MSYVNYTPGTGKVYFRGIADDNGTFIAEESTALYIDEQPVTQAGMAVDVRMIDIARIEASIRAISIILTSTAIPACVTGCSSI